MQDHTYGNFENSRLERVFKDSKRLMGAEPAHDFEHVMRVYKNVEFLCRAENLNSELALAASLLHDIILYPKTGKNAKNSAKESADAAKTILNSDFLLYTKIQHFCTLSLHARNRVLVLLPSGVLNP